MSNGKITFRLAYIYPAMLLMGCSSSTDNSPELFTRGELMSFDETGRTARQIPDEDIMVSSVRVGRTEMPEVADEMKIDRADSMPPVKGDDPVAAIIVADEERKKILKEKEEEIQPRNSDEQVQVAAVETKHGIAEEGELPIDQSYWKPHPEEILSDVSSSSGVTVAMSRPSDSAENFKVSRGSSARLSNWFVLNAPKRLVLDFDDVVGNGFSTKHVLPMDSKYVSEVRVGSYEGRSRVVLDIASPDCVAEVLSGKNAEEVEISLTSDGRG